MKGVIDHARLFAKIAEALTIIGESIERAELYSKIYSPDVVLPILARLYGHVLLFLQKAVKWYTGGPLRRMFKSVSDPYEIGYKNTVDEIKLCTASLDSVADSAAKVELRRVTISLQDLDSRLSHFQDEFFKYTASWYRAQDKFKGRSPAFEIQRIEADEK